MKLKKYVKDPNAPSAEDKALEKFAEMIVKKIENLQVKWDKPWFTTKSMMAENMDGRQYSGFNQLFLLFVTEDEEFTAPIFATFDKITKLNYDDEGKCLPDNKKNPQPKVSINKGAKSYPVFCTTYKVINRETKEAITMGEYMKLTEDEKKEYKVFANQHVHNVFNIDQTNLKESRPELYKKLVERNKRDDFTEVQGKFTFRKVDDLISSQGWVCPVKHKKQDRAYYSPSKDEIILPLFKQFKYGEAYYSTAIHEMAHSTGHADRLNREGVTSTAGFGSEIYGKEELVAELTSALVCHSYGINNGIEEQSCAYIKGWCKNIKEDPKFIKTILTDVKKASDMIKKHIDTIQ